jgi:hypothetical protein
MNHLVCKNLRTKSMYTLATPEEALVDKEGRLGSPCHFWCNLTQTVVGLDDRPVHKQSCNPSRRCYEES